MAARIEDWKPHLGRKVSMRFKLHDSDHPFSEAIGVIASVAVDDGGEQSVTVIDRSGESKTISSDDIVAAKLFPI